MLLDRSSSVHLVWKAARIKTIINRSQASGDGMHVLELQNRQDVDSMLTIWCHKNCVCCQVEYLT